MQIKIVSTDRWYKELEEAMKKNWRSSCIYKAGLTSILEDKEKRVIQEYHLNILELNSFSFNLCFI
ncbi:uncharacterized protein DS421_15g516770 [Arachis hypogaea]|nr:uncharacterized protein DS421_15g516770 [Arachis hypogaea]